MGAGPPIQGGVPTWGGTSYLGVGLTTIGAGPPTCGGGVATGLLVLCLGARPLVLTNPEAGGSTSTYSFGLEVGPDRVRGVHSRIDLKSKVSRGDLSYGMLRKTLLRAYRLAIHHPSSSAYTNWSRVTYWEF